MAALLARMFVGEATIASIAQLDRLRASVLAFSWLAIMLLGSEPILEEVYRRPHSMVAPAVLAFCVAVSSAAVLRQYYCWLGAALHIIGQIMIWLSLFSLSIAFFVL